MIYFFRSYGYARSTTRLECDVKEIHFQIFFKLNLSATFYLYVFQIYNQFFRTNVIWTIYYNSFFVRKNNNKKNFIFKDFLFTNAMCWRAIFWWLPAIGLAPFIQTHMGMEFFFSVTIFLFVGIFWKLNYHTSKINDFRWTLQNLLYFNKKKTHIFCFSFQATFIFHLWIPWSMSS